MKAGDEEGFFKKLEKEFEPTFMWLIPGILHDFGNALNGILGRSELLQGRAEHQLILNNDNKIDDEILEGCKRMIYDSILIAKEADRLSSLFNVVSEKLQSVSDTALQKINLSELVEAEMKFLQFYRDVKYNIKMKLILDRKLRKYQEQKPIIPFFCLQYSDIR